MVVAKEIEMSLRDRVAFLSQGTQGMSKTELLTDWHDAVRELYSLVREVVAPLIKENYISVQESSVKIEEVPIGKYSLPQLELLSGPKIVTFKPIGRMVAGATGRIDAKGSGSAKWVRLLRTDVGENSKWNVLSSLKLNALMPLVFSDFSQEVPNPKGMQLIPIGQGDIEVLLDRLFAD